MSHFTLPQCYDPERAAATLPPDTSRLKVVGHSLAAVASLPRRLANPPPRSSNLKLSDVLADRHCSPLSLVDFEHYLTYTEHSVENLYFTLWLQAYTAEHANLQHSDSSAVTRVSNSVVTAARTYIDPDAPYEINLTDQGRSDLLALSPFPPPPPSAYHVARSETQRLLEDSFQRWEKRAKSNAGWIRLAFSTYLGLANACVTVAAMIIARVFMHGSSGRILAACLTPWLWFAIVGVVCGLKGVCFLCFSVGGSVRQVSSFELALPRISPSIHSINKVIPATSFSSLENPCSPHNNGSEKSDVSGTDKTQYPRDPFSPPTARASEFSVNPRAITQSHNRRNMSKAMLVKFWAPMVEIEDPLIVRAHWEAVVKGFLWSLFYAVPIGVIAASV